MRKFILLLIAAVLLPFAVYAQVTARTTTLLTLTGNTTIATTTTGVLTSQAFTIKPGSGFAVVPNFQLAGADVANPNITFAFAVSLDGTTWSTTKPFTYAEAANGATPVIGFKNFSAPVTGAGADNIQFVRLASVQNASANQTCTVNSVTITRNN